MLRWPDASWTSSEPACAWWKPRLSHQSSAPPQLTSPTEFRTPSLAMELRVTVLATSAASHGPERTRAARVTNTASGLGEPTFSRSRASSPRGTVASVLTTSSATPLMRTAMPATPRATTTRDRASPRRMMRALTRTSISSSDTGGRTSGMRLESSLATTALDLKTLSMLTSWRSRLSTDSPSWDRLASP